MLTGGGGGAERERIEADRQTKKEREKEREDAAHGQGRVAPAPPVDVNTPAQTLLDYPNPVDVRCTSILNLEVCTLHPVPLSSECGAYKTVNAARPSNTLVASLSPLSSYTSVALFRDGGRRERENAAHGQGRVAPAPPVDVKS